MQTRASAAAKQLSTATRFYLIPPCMIRYANTPTDANAAIDKNIAIASIVVKRVPWRCRIFSNSPSRLRRLSLRCPRTFRAGGGISADRFQGAADGAEAVGHRLVLVIQGFDAFAQAFEDFLLVAADSLSFCRISPSVPAAAPGGAIAGESP